MTGGGADRLVPHVLAARGIRSDSEHRKEPPTPAGAVGTDRRAPVPVRIVGHARRAYSTQGACPACGRSMRLTARRRHRSCAIDSYHLAHGLGDPQDVRHARAPPRTRDGARLVERRAGLAPASPCRKRGVFPWTTNARPTTRSSGGLVKIKYSVHQPGRTVRPQPGLTRLRAVRLPDVSEKSRVPDHRCDVRLPANVLAQLFLARLGRQRGAGPTRRLVCGLHSAARP